MFKNKIPDLSKKKGLMNALLELIRCIVCAIYSSVRLAIICITTAIRCRAKPKKTLEFELDILAITEKEQRNIQQIGHPKKKKSENQK